MDGRDRATAGGRDRATEPTDRERGRATVPAVGKALEAAIVVLYVGLLTTTLFTGYVADYRASAGDELADRTLATASHEVRGAIPPAATSARAHVRVDLPDTIRGEDYRIETDGEHLVLDHPDRAVGGRTRLALPDRVDSLSGSWHSQRPAAVRVAGTDGDLAVRLVAGDAAEEGLPDDGDGSGSPADPCDGPGPPGESCNDGPPGDPCEGGPPCGGDGALASPGGGRR